MFFVDLLWVFWWLLRAAFFGRDSLRFIVTFLVMLFGNGYEEADARATFAKHGCLELFLIHSELKFH
jgi:hypothetical protein